MDELNPATIPQNNNVPPTPPAGMPQPAPQPAGIVPPPPANGDVRVRTMESDARSVAMNGGAEPVPQFVTPVPPMASAPMPAQSAPVQTAPAPAPMPDVRESKSGRLLLWLVMLVVIVGVGWLSYKYGLPAYRAMMPNEPLQEAEAQPAAPEPSAAGLAAVPVPPPAVTPFGATRDALPKIETDGTTASIAGALAAEAKKAKMASGTVQEVAVMNAGAPMSFDTYMGALLPEAATNGLAGVLTAGFDPVFSAYLFYDDRGAWPGYVAKINPAAQIDAATLASRMQAIETSSYKNFFLADPGTAAAFRTGQARDKYIDRFAAFGADGALFSYGIFGDYLIINTSNNGLVKALDLLKL